MGYYGLPWDFMVSQRYII